MDTELRIKNGKLVGTVKYTGPLKGVDSAEEFLLRPIDPETFVTGPEGLAEFIDFDAKGRPRYVHMGGRVSKRASDSTAKRRARPKPKAKAAKRKR